MIKPPIIITLLGNKTIAADWVGHGKDLVRRLEHDMTFAKLQQATMHEREVATDVFISARIIYGVRELSVRVAGVPPKDKEGFFPYCFANRTISIGTIIGVVGVASPEDPNEECEPEAICQTCIAPNSYPSSYYCTMGIRYNVEICANDDEYIYFENMPSTDYAQHCPGDRILVVLEIVDSSEYNDIVYNAKESPTLEALTFPRLFQQREIAHFLILPYIADIPLHEIKEDFS